MALSGETNQATLRCVPPLMSGKPIQRQPPDTLALASCDLLTLLYALAGKWFSKLLSSYVDYF